jgi:hypothetical protein
MQEGNDGSFLAGETKEIYLKNALHQLREENAGGRNSGPTQAG